MKKIKFYIVLVLLISDSFGSFAQSLYSRIEADISIKEVYPNDAKSLMLGKVFFDLESNRLVYKITFPEKEIIVMSDSSMASYKNDSIRNKPSSPQVLDFTIYKLLLTGDMKMFGIDQSKFLLEEISESGGKVIAEWIPKTEPIPFKIIISQSNNLIDGIALLDPEGNVKSKQIFKDYNKYGRIQFPLTIYEMSYSTEGEYKKLMKHTNIKLNNYSDENSSYDPTFSGVGDR